MYKIEKKFNNLRYIVEQGIVEELDFSGVDNLFTHWRFKNNKEDLREIIGIKYLKNLKDLILFCVNWGIENEFCLDCQI